MLNQCEWGSKRLRTHSARVVPLVRRLGRSLGHVIRHHIESGTEGGGDVSEFDVLAKHVHAQMFRLFITERKGNIHWNVPSRVEASKAALKQLPACHATRGKTEEPYDPQRTTT